MINDFPRGASEQRSSLNGEKEHQNNPAIKLFGLRFFADQSPLELLEELFLILVSKKEVDNCCIDKYLPEISFLQSWQFDRMVYYPQEKLNLKLFSFFGTSRLENRHKTHRQHCYELWNMIKKKMNTEEGKKDDALNILIDLFSGFWGNGSSRVWCAQNFLPFCKELLSGEIIWPSSGARDIETWQAALEKFRYTQHLFLARGGELLYLQLCNAFSQSSETVGTWLKNTKRWEGLCQHERYPNELHHRLQKKLSDFFRETPNQLNELSRFIETSGSIPESGVSECKITCGWCPVESWHEGYLFAVELLRILEARIDLMEKVDLLQIACAMQLMRSLAAQSYRYCLGDKNGDGMNYRLLFSEIEETDRKRKEISQTTLNDVCLTIYEAMRVDAIKDTIPAEEREKRYKEADNRYGHKLIVKIGKNTGLIVPKTGAKARFVLTEKLLRFFVIALVPTHRMRLDRFRENIAQHFGFVFDECDLIHSPDWTLRAEQLDLNAERTTFLEKMLKASGVLVTLSDSCSLVKNPFCQEVEQ